MARLTRGQDEAIDLTVLRTATGEDPDLMKEIASLYVSDAGPRLAALGEAIAEGDLDRARLVAHSLKGASASIGAGPAADAFAELEMAAREGDLSRVAAAASTGRLAVDRACRALSRL
jgi:HPt (histidine-containing phosphotransfer) domain-containing protein